MFDVEIQEGRPTLQLPYNLTGTVSMLINKSMFDSLCSHLCQMTS